MRGDQVGGVVGGNEIAKNVLRGIILFRLQSSGSTAFCSFCFCSFCAGSFGAAFGLVLGYRCRLFDCARPPTASITLRQAVSKRLTVQMRILPFQDSRRLFG